MTEPSAAPLRVAILCLLAQTVVATGAGAEAMVTAQRTLGAPVSGTVAKGAWKHFGPYDLNVGQTLTASIAGSGDADLYVRIGAWPTLSSFDCRPHTSTTNESCTIPGPGKIHVSVNGYGSSSTFQLQIGILSRQ